MEGELSLGPLKITTEVAVLLLGGLELNLEPGVFTEFDLQNTAKDEMKYTRVAGESYVQEHAKERSRARREVFTPRCKEWQTRKGFKE
eukprot:1142153-Pelagomonas_calceolata.AAC.3